MFQCKRFAAKTSLGWSVEVDEDRPGKATNHAGFEPIKSKNGCHVHLANYLPSYQTLDPENQTNKQPVCLV